MRPVADLVRLRDPIAFRDPDQRVIVDPAPLCELEDPLEPQSNAIAIGGSFDAAHALTDLARRPAVLAAIGEGEEEAIDPEASPAENRSSCFGCCNDHPPHPANPSPLIHVLQYHPWGQRTGCVRCYLFDKPRGHGNGACYSAL